MNYLLCGITFVTALIFARILIPKIIAIAYHYSIFDNLEKRKLHASPIPRLGGISFIFCIFFSILIAYTLQNSLLNQNKPTEHLDLAEFNLFACAYIILYVGGVIDDLIGMRYRKKFLLQIASTVLIAISGVYIHHLHGFLGITAISPYIGIPGTVLILIFIINAMNLIDGIDGLSAGISIIAFSMYGMLFLLLNKWYYAILAFSANGTLFAFFYYNVFGNLKKKRKLFMGDAGSMTLGLLLGFMALQYFRFSPEDMHIPVESAIVIAVSPILLPIFDVLRVILYRIKTKKHLFTADRSHIHHKLMNAGMSKPVTLITLLGVCIGFCFLNFTLINFINSLFIIVIDITIWTVSNMILSYIIKKRQSNQRAGLNE